MSIDRLLRANRMVLAVPVIDGPSGPLLISATGTTCPFTAPTSAVLDSWRAVVTTSATGAGNGGNISCALLDDLSLGLAGSDTDTELTICSIGNESAPTLRNVDAKLTGFRDASQSDTGVFNLFLQLMNAAGVRYVFVDRIGKSSTATVVSGDVVSLFDMATDLPIDVRDDKANLKLEQDPVSNGNINVNYTLLS